MTAMPNSEHELPTPVSGGIDLFNPGSVEISSPASAEKPLIPSEKEPTSEGAPRVTPGTTTSSQTPSATTLVASTSDASDHTVSMAASGDPEVIDKVWVDRAKKVISETSTNPSEQVKVIGRVKADYQKSRFNRDLKTDEKS